MGHLGESVGKELLCGLWAGFLVKCFTQLVVLAFLWRLSRACSTVLLAVPCSTPGFFWIVWEKVGLFGPVPLTWESQALTHTLLPAPASKTTGQGGLSWHWAVSLWVTGDQVKWTSSSYSLTNALLSMGYCLTRCSLTENARNFIFCHENVNLSLTVKSLKSISYRIFSTCL